MYISFTMSADSNFFRTSVGTYIVFLKHTVSEHLRILITFMDSLILEKSVWNKSEAPVIFVISILAPLAKFIKY